MLITYICDQYGYQKLYTKEKKGKVKGVGEVV